MKTYFRHWLGVILFIVLALPQLYAQQIDYAEYFFDTDPGYGNGNSLSISSTNTIDASYSISTTLLQPGVHILYVRTKANTGEWSLSAVRTVYITQNTTTQDKISQAEYFIDTDPGAGNGTVISISSSDTLNVLSSIPAFGLNPGFHQLFVRVKDGNGVWSVPAVRNVFVTENHTITQLAAAEYFFDDDPGYGNATALSVSAGNVIDTDYIVASNNLSVGIHKLYVRVKDLSGLWSTTQRTVVYVSAASKDIVAAEYFYDNDPGFGNGTSVNITQGTNIDLTQAFTGHNLSQGIHFIYLRLKDENGKWSVARKNLVYVVSGTAQSPPIVNGEYFFGQDPGQSSATSFTLTKGQTIDLSTVIASVGLGVGLHYFNVRLQDSIGRWSMCKRSLVYVTPSEASQNIVAIEYSVDTVLPIGQGNQVSINASDSLDHTFSFNHGIIDTNYHMLYTRIKDAGGRWSLLDSLTFRLASCVIPTASFTLHDICLGDTLLLVNNSTQIDTATTYAWNIQNDASVDYTAKDSIQHYFANPGAYDILLKVNNYVCEDTMLQTVNVHPRPVASLSSFGSTTFCPSGFTVLSTNTGIGYTYEWFRNGNLLANVNSSFYQAADTGDYRVAISNIYNCTDTSGLLSLSQYTFPDAAITAAGNTTFCEGDSVVLQANTLAGLSYEWYQNGNVISGENSNSLTVLQSGSYAVKITSLDGCSDISSPQQIVVNANPVASLSAGGPTVFCQGSDVVIYASNGPGYAYQWYKDGQLIPNASSSFYSADSSGNYQAVVSNSFACFDTTSTLNVDVNPLPQVQISFSVVTNLCQGDSSLLQVTTDNGNTFQWKSYGVNLMGATDTFYYPSQSGSYSVLVSNAYGCSQESASQSISINQLPGASILPLSSTSFCDGDSVILQANIGQGLAYQWFKDGVVLVGDTSDQLSVSQTGAYTVEVSNGFQCTSVSSAANVNVFTKPTALFTLPDEKCGSDTVVIHYTGNASSGAFYNWNFGGATVLTGTGQGPYQLRWNTSGTHDVSLMVNENACISEPFSDSIAIKTVTAIVSSSNTSVCQGDSVYITANAGTNYTYQWYQGGMEITGATSSYLSANSTAHYTVEVSDSVLGCAQMSAPLAVNVFTNDFNLAISANTTNFSQPPFDVSFSNNTPNLSSYLFEWNFGDGTTSNFYQPFHTYLYNGSYTVQLYAENATTGCRDTLIQTNFISCTGGAPNPCNIIAAITPPGPATICNGDSVLLSASAGTAYSYQWVRNGMVLPGADSIALWVKQAGNYRVIITDSVCSQTSPAFVLNHYPSIQPQISINGYIQPCTDDSLELFLPTSYVQYNWSTGDSGSRIYVSQTGYYTVAVQDHYGCVMQSLPYTVNTSFLQPPEVCIVGVDTSNHNRIVWERPANALIDSIYVYRESVVAGQYDVIGALDYSDPGIFSDVNSNPAVRSYRYRLAAKDTCGDLTLMSTVHKTIHLTINAGLNGSWNLIWDGYIGFPFGSYRIYRGTNSAAMSLLTQLPSTSTSYTDLNPPAGTVYYQIEVVKSSGCYPDSTLAKAATNFNTSRSNVADNASIAPVFLNADFSADVLTGQWPIQVSFTDLSTGNPNTWLWDFGDGNTSVEQSPQHTYNNTGLYTVRLQVCNQGVCDTITKSNYIDVQPNGIVKVGVYLDAKVYPNPNDGTFTLEVNSAKAERVYLSIFNNQGQQVHTESYQVQSESFKKLNLQHYAKGIYYIHLGTENGIAYREKVVIQ